MTLEDSTPTDTLACTHELIIVDGKVRCAKCECLFSLMSFVSVDQDDFWE